MAEPLGDPELISDDTALPSDNQSGSANGQRRTVAVDKRKRKRPPKMVRDAIKKRVDDKIMELTGAGVLSKELYAYRKIAPVYKNGIFIGFKCSWKPTIEMPAAFIESPEPLQKLKMYQGKSLDEIVEDLLEKQKALERN